MSLLSTFCLIIYLNLTQCTSVNLPAINKTSLSNQAIAKRRSSSISTIFKLRDVVNVIPSNSKGQIIEVNARKRQYLIQYSQPNTSNKWISEHKLKKVSIAYFHKIDDIDDPKTCQILNLALDRRKYPQSIIFVPNEFGFNERKYNSITTPSSIYYYQNPDTFYLKSLGDILCLFADIQKCSQSYFPSILGVDFFAETCLYFKRIMKYADEKMLKHFMAETVQYYAGHRFLQNQFAQFLAFCDEYNALTMDKLFERERWERHFDDYMKREIDDGRFDVDAYIYLIKEMVKYYDARSYEKMQQFVVKMHLIGLSGLNVSEITNEIDRITQNVNGTLDDIDCLHQIGDSNIFYQRAYALQQLTKNKLIFFDCLEVICYLYYWMIKQCIVKDVHLFLSDELMNNHFFATIVIDTLKTCGMNVKLQLVFL